jgi:hypothetical protein
MINYKLKTVPQNGKSEKNNQDVDFNISNQDLIV